MAKILIIEAKFYDELANKLAEGAIEVLDKADCDYERLAVPGCFEIPAALAMAIKSKKYDAYVTLGCVIRGETSHYDYVCDQSAQGINNLAIKKTAAIGYGIITAENRQQANVRADKSQKNVGGRAATAALEMLKIKQQMKKDK